MRVSKQATNVFLLVSVLKGYCRLCCASFWY